MTPQYMSTAKKLAILDNDALGQFAEANKNDAMMLAMAMSEKARRDAIKADQMAQATPMGMQPTVKDQKVAELRQPAGLAALPASNMEAMGTRAAKGGIMTYAGGGFTDEQILNKVRAEAARRGLNPDTVLGILRAENAKLDPTASPETSSAFGLFQTTEATWKAMGGDPKKKTDVDEQIRIGLDLIQDNDTKLGDALGRQPTPTESYTAHVVGLGKAIQMGQAAPDAKVEDILGEAAVKANPTLFKGKTVAQATDILGKKVGAGAPEDRTPAYLRQSTVPTAEGIAREQAQTAQNIAAERARVEGLPVGERLLGAGEAGLSALTGAASIPLAGAAALFGPRQEGESAEQAFARRAEAMTFAPRTAEGQRQLKEFGKAIEETKLPPVLPGVMGTAGTTPARRGAISDAAFLAGKADEAQAAVGAAQRAATPALQSPQAAARSAKQRAAAQQAQAELSASERVLGTTPRERAEAAARATRQAQERAAAALPEAQRRAAGAMSAADEAVARAAQAPGQQLVMPVVTPTAALAGPKPEGGIRDLAKGTAAPIAAMTPDEQAGLNAMAPGVGFAEGAPGDFDVGDATKFGKQFIDSLPKEEKKGLEGLLGKLDNDFYLSLGIGLLSQPDFGQGLAYGTQLYMTRKDAKTKAEAGAKETASEIAEREARTAESRARTKALESGDRMRQKALELAQKDVQKDIMLMTRTGPEADAARNRALEEAYSRNLMLLQNSPVGLQSTIPGADFSKWGSLRTK